MEVKIRPSECCFVQFVDRLLRYGFVTIHEIARNNTKSRIMFRLSSLNDWQLSNPESQQNALFRTYPN